eukprot:5699151-Pyramimonas_sp.AAC.1
MWIKCTLRVPSSTFGASCVRGRAWRPYINAYEWQVALGALFEQRAVKKQYVAIVHGYLHG